MKQLFFLATTALGGTINTNGYGSFTVNVLSTNSPTGKYAHVATIGQHIYLVELVTVPDAVGPQIEPITTNIVGRAIISKEVIIGPRGCDNRNPLLAVENSNCVANSVEAHENRLLLHALWYLPARDDACILAGGDEYSWFVKLH